MRPLALLTRLVLNSAKDLWNVFHHNPAFADGVALSSVTIGKSNLVIRFHVVSGFRIDDSVLIGCLDDSDFYAFVAHGLGTPLAH